MAMESHSPTSRGSRRERAIIFQDEEKTQQRRRSSRIIALEEKRKKDRKNNSSNQVNNINKGKRNKTTYPMQEEQHSANGNTLRTNVPSQNDMPRKHTLESVLDLLQRNDPEELFAKPANHDMVEDCYSIVKQPMDFATMRIKLHEGMYTSMEHFKRDVYLMCTNAINANSPNTRRHQVAKVINSNARRIFENLSAPNSEHFQLESSSLNKRTPASQGRKPRGGQPRTTEHAMFRRKPAGNTALEINKRDNHWLSNDKSLLSSVLNAHQNIQVFGNYKDSLLRFVEELGPTAKKVAAKKLETLKYMQLMNVETPIPNPRTNVFGTWPTPQQAPTQPNALNNAHELSLALSLSNKPPTIPENKNANTIADSVNINGSAASVQGLVQQGANQNLELQLELGVGSTSKDASSSSRHVHGHVWPTHHAISGLSFWPQRMHGLARSIYSSNPSSALRVEMNDAVGKEETSLLPSA